MSHFQVLILPIDKVENHPNADRLSLNHIRGYVAVSNKNDGAHRYKAGDLVAYVPLGAVVPDSLLKANGYWDDKKEKGFLGGPKGNIVTAINLRGVVSRGLIFPTDIVDSVGFGDTGLPRDVQKCYCKNGDGHIRLVNSGDDVAPFLNITKHEQPLLWDDGVYLGFSIRYDVEDLKKFPDILNGHQVVITELLHGVLCVVGYDRTLDNPFFVSSGPMAENAFRFVDGVDNIYIQMAKPIWEDIKRYLKEMPAVEKFYLFGEIIGPGIQDITYGLDKPEFRALDIQMALMGGGRDSIPFGFIGPMKYQLFTWLNIPSAPILWAGKFDRHVVGLMINEPSFIGGGLRKGVVITSEDENLINRKRPILKDIADKYLLRTAGTDFK